MRDMPKFREILSYSYIIILQYISIYLFDGKHHDGSYDGNSYTGQDTEGAGPNELVWVFESLLEGADGQEGEVLLLLGVADQVDVHQLLDLRGGGGGKKEGRERD